MPKYEGRLWGVLVAAGPSRCSLVSQLARPGQAAASGMLLAAGPAGQAAAGREYPAPAPGRCGMPPGRPASPRQLRPVRLGQAGSAPAGQIQGHGLMSPRVTVMRKTLESYQQTEGAQLSSELESAEHRGRVDTLNPKAAPAVLQGRGLRGTKYYWYTGLSCCCTLH